MTRRRERRRIVARVRIVRERRAHTIERPNWSERTIETFEPELDLVVAARPMTLEETLSILDMGVRQ